MCCNFVIPSENECVVYMKIDNLPQNCVGTFIPYKLKLAKLCIIAAQSVSNCVDGFIPICLCNLREAQVKIYKNTVFGQFELIESDNNAVKSDYINIIGNECDESDEEIVC